MGTGHDMEVLQNTAVAKLAARLGVNIRVNEQMTSTPIRTSRGNAITKDTLMTAAVQLFTYQVEGASIRVNGIEIGIVNSPNTAYSILREIQESHIPVGSAIVYEETTFVENVEVVSVFIDPDEVISRDTVFHILTRTSEYMDTYTTVIGDSPWLVASRAGMTLERLRELNEGVRLDPLDIDVTLNIVVQRPTISVRTIEEYTRIEPEPAPLETIEMPDQPSSFRRVIHQGQDGQAEVIMRITRLNGMEISRHEHARNIIEEPIPEVLEVGTGY